MTTTLPVSSPRRSRQAVLRHLRVHRAPALLGVGSLVASAAVSLVTAPLLGDIVDLAARGDTGPITRRALALAGAALVQALLAWIGLAAVARVGEQVLAGLREAFVEHALGLPLERIERGGSGDLISRVTEDVAMVSEAVRTAVPQFVQAALVIALTAVGLAVLDWRFLLAALVAVPVQVWTSRWYMRRSGPMYARTRTAGAAEQQQWLESLGGAPTVRAFGLADEHVELVRHRVDDSLNRTVGVVRLHMSFFSRLNLAEAMGLSTVLVTGFVLVREDLASVGTASAAALYFVNLFGPINRMLFLLDTLQSATASLARIVGVTEVPTDGTTSAVHASDVRPRDGEVVANGLRHAYVEGHDVLHGLDVTVPAGSTVALVGGSGGGKSTLAALLAGVRRPDHGRISIGGADLSGLDPATMRASVVLVTQEVHVFAGTLAADLRLAAPDADEQRLMDALTDVGADTWVGALPDGLETVVGEGGHELGPQQAQQLALARVLLTDPLVAILDEATAEAGSAGSRALETAAERVLAGRTGVLVAHRFSQAVLADLVLVMDGGRVVEQGRHDELVAAGGRYAGLWAAWSAGRTPA
ncbi:ABC transporter ATP-binding protein [Kineosporia mesophila]|uniref:ABC transporter ATP-binding protein n=1 Tax=Kineosporia mesophila TaxID=566012 RepID=A0ABP6Z9G3_9ACTN|nr:ABC transporter ATP-binding protein [Kineosporia mesophila]MCD5353035.1 ABC transporter ATP-binding protein/permease [Kineosporia mesophila]